MHNEELSGRLRRFLLLILILGLLGTLAELLIAEHTEDTLQWIPLVLLAAALLVLVWHALARQSRLCLRVWQAMMMLFIVAGFTGIALHMKGKMEFKQESDPALRGWKLLVASLESKTPPPLAPGVMIQMGLLGLAFAYRHPALRAAPPGHGTESAPHAS